MKINISAALLLLILSLTVFSCGTTREIRSETSAQTRIRRNDEIRAEIDSVFVYRHDSVFILQKSDTVIIERFKTKISYRDRRVADTVRITDTVRIEVEKIVESVKQESWFARQRNLIVSLFVLIVCLIVFKRVLK